MEKELQVVGFRIGRETFGLPFAWSAKSSASPKSHPSPTRRITSKASSIYAGESFPSWICENGSAKSFEPNKKNRIVVVELESRVDRPDRAFRIRGAADSALGNRGPAQRLSGKRTQLHHRGRQIEGRLVILLDLGRILQHGEFRRLMTRRSLPAVPVEAARQDIEEFERARSKRQMSTTHIRKCSSPNPNSSFCKRSFTRNAACIFDERRTHFLRDRLQRRVKACQIDTFYGYYRLLTSREGKKELTALLENLTVNETSFFRIRPQLELFQKVALEGCSETQAGAS